MRRLALFAFYIATVPGLAFGQTSRWDDAIKAAEQAVRQQQYREAESQFVQAEKDAETFGPLDHRVGMTLNNLAELYVREARYTEAESLVQTRPGHFGGGR